MKSPCVGGPAKGRSGAKSCTAAAPQRSASCASSIAVFERGVRNADHHRHAVVGELNGAADQVLALGQTEVGVFLSLDAGGDDHGGAAILDYIVDQAGEAGFVDL